MGAGGPAVHPDDPVPGQSEPRLPPDRPRSDQRHLLLRLAHTLRVLRGRRVDARHDRRFIYPMTTSPGEPGERLGYEAEGRSLPPLSMAAAILVVATVLGLLESSHVQYDRAVQGDPIDWPHALIHGLPRWYAWALLAPAVILLARWIHGLRVGTAPTVLLHVLAGAAVGVVQVAIFASTSSLLHGRPDPVAHFQPAVLKYMGLTFFGNVITYASLVGGWYTFLLYRRYRQREAEAARLQLQSAELKALLAESHLQRLQAQLEPHFLFNSLHALSSLMLQGDSIGAIRMTRRLSELLRRALRAGEKAEHSLQEELELVREYLEIQQLRFEDRLEAEVNADAAVAHAAVPALLLQPLVENAIRHGIEADSDARRVAIRAALEDDQPDRLRITVRNEGPEFGASTRRGVGVGLENTRNRLRVMYGDEARLEIRDLAGGGVEAEVILPYRPAGATPPTAAPAGDLQ